MKNRFLWLLILGVTLFTACNDNDDKPLIAPEELNTTFGTGESILKMTYGGVELLGKQVTFNTQNSKTATLTLKDIIPGKTEVTINDIQLVEANEMYTFEGSSSISRSTASQNSISYSGSIKKGELSLNLNVTFADDSHLLKTYTLNDYVKEKLTYQWGGKPNTIASCTEGALYVNWVAKDENNEYGVSYGKSYRAIGSIILPQILQSITLNEDGNVQAAYYTGTNEIAFKPLWFALVPTAEQVKALIPTTDWTNSPKNLAFWFIKDNKVYVKLNIANIIAQTMTEAPASTSSTNNFDLASIINMALQADAATIKNLIKQFANIDINSISDESINTLLKWINTGFPLNVKQEENHTYLYFDKEALETFLKPSDPTDPASADIMKLWDILTKAEVIPSAYSQAKLLIQYLPQYWSITESIGLGLDLK